MISLSSIIETIDRHWCIEPRFAESALAQLEGIDYGMHVAIVAARRRSRTASEEDGPGYEMVGRTAVFLAKGPLTKVESSWGDGTSTEKLRQAMDAARMSPDVGNAILLCDSPGGQVDGNEACANAIDAFQAAGKPMIALVSGMCCSAMYWLAARCTAIVSDAETNQIGSIGTRTAVNDYSAAFAMQGIKAHSIATGEFKGAGTRGTTITAAHLADWQREVEEINQVFKEAISTGRGMDAQTVDTLADGRVYTAREALKIGLIDEIGSLDEVLSALNASPGKTKPTTKAAQSGKEKTSDMSLQTLLAAYKKEKGDTLSAEEQRMIDAAVKAEAAPPIVPPLPPTVPPLPAPAPAQASAEIVTLAASVKAQGEQMATLMAQNTLLMQQMQAERSASSLAAANSEITALVRQMRISPATAEGYRTMAKDQPIQFEAILPALKALPANRSLARETLKTGGKDGGTSDPGLTLDAAVKTRMAQTKETYDVAAAAVVREKPDLATAHAEDMASKMGLGE